MTTTLRLRRAALFALVATLWLGCASSPAPRDQFYRLTVAAPTARPVPALSGALEVDRMRVEAVAQGRRMLYREASRPNAINQHSYHYWTDAPGVMLQDLLAHYLRAAGVARSVVTPGIRVDSDFVLKGRVVRLERQVGGGSARVVVELRFSLISASGRQVLLDETYLEERKVASDGVDAAIPAYDDAVATIFGRLLADIPQG